MAEGRGPIRIGVLGGGMMGLAVALQLARAGRRLQVTVLEREPELGGLCRSRQLLPDLRWDRFYHVILSSDTALLDFLAQLDLQPEVRFATTRTGFFAGGRLYSLSSTWEFLRFPPLSLLDKARLGLGILYAARLRDGSRLERQLARSWLRQVFGRRNTERLWEPLLRAKLGSASEQTSAAFIWATIRRLYGTRQELNRQERMGYVQGGYATILARLGERLAQAGATIRSSWPVTRLRPHPDGEVTVEGGPGERLVFDRVVSTLPGPELARVWPDAPPDFAAQLGRVGYLGLVCVTLVLKRSLSPYYITNITDDGFPLTGIIETTALVPPAELGARHLVYLPRYLPSGDPWFQRTDAQVTAELLEALRRVHPSLRDDEILATVVERESLVQPLQELGYGDRVPPWQSPAASIWLASNAMIRNSTLNNDQVVRLAQELCRRLLPTL